MGGTIEVDSTQVSSSNICRFATSAASPLTSAITRRRGAPKPSGTLELEVISHEVSPTQVVPRSPFLVNDSSFQVQETLYWWGKTWLQRGL